jgi:hypothetical protein
MRKTRGSNLICIRSRDLQNSDIIGNSGSLVLHETIIAEEEEQISICLHSAVIPNSFHNLSAYLKNNTLTFSEDGGADNTITLDDGSYSINELTAVVKTKMEAISPNTLTYNFSYSEINNSLTITTTSELTITINFIGDENIRRFFGFTDAIHTLPMTSNRAVDITDTRNSIYIRLPNLTNQKVIESNNGKYSNIIAHIPVPLSRNTIFEYQPSNPFCMSLNQKTINSIEILITFQDQNEKVDFGRGDWELNFLIEFHELPKNKRLSHTIHKDIEDKIQMFEKRKQEDEVSFNKLKDLISKSKIESDKDEN